MSANAPTPKEIARAVYGSKMVFILEIFTLTATWAIKGCLVILYSRLTERTSKWHRRAIWIVAAYCVITYLVVTLLFLFYWCYPTYEYWTVPVKISELLTREILISQVNIDQRQANVRHILTI